MKTLLLSLLVLSQVVFGCGLPTELDDSDCGIIYMGSWEAIEGGYHIALTTDLPSMEGYLHPQEDGIYDIYEDHFDLPNRTKVLYTLLGKEEGYLVETDQRFPSKNPLFKSVPLKKGETIKIKLEVLPPNIEEERIVVFDKLRLVKVK
jgi:lipoprotein